MFRKFFRPEKKNSSVRKSTNSSRRHKQRIPPQTDKENKSLLNIDIKSVAMWLHLSTIEKKLDLSLRRWRWRWRFILWPSGEVTLCSLFKKSGSTSNNALLNNWIMVNNHFGRKCYSASHITEHTGYTIRLKNGSRKFLPEFISIYQTIRRCIP